jgi:hypothetical protein
MIFKKKSLAAFQGSSSASRRQWRGCLFEEIQQGAAKGKAVSALCQMTGPHRAGFYRWRVPRQATPVEMEIRELRRHDGYRPQTHRQGAGGL